MKLFRFILGIFLFWFISAPAHVPFTLELHLQPYTHHCRWIFTAPVPIHYRLLTLTHPDRLVIDFKQARLVKRFSAASLMATPVESIRIGSHENNELRIVFDLKNNVSVREATFKPSSSEPHYQLVLDFTWSSTVSPVVESFTPRAKDVIVVIDPGHGGKDPGAIGSRGTPEKVVVLQIARYLRDALNQQSGFKAYLTRQSDYYLTLRERLSIARRHQADLFIAVHADANAYRRWGVAGASVYALSERGATSEAARWLAEKENQSELMGGVNLTDKNSLLKSVLINLSQTATIRFSLQIAHRILQSLSGVGHLHHRKVEQAAFVVLKSPDIPSLLVETGFISNPADEEKLRNPKYQARIALALMQGIRAHFVYSPPRGTWLAQQKMHSPIHAIPPTN